MAATLRRHAGRQGLPLADPERVGRLRDLEQRRQPDRGQVVMLRGGAGFAQTRRTPPDGRLRAGRRGGKAQPRLLRHGGRHAGRLSHGDRGKKRGWPTDESIMRDNNRGGGCVVGSSLLFRCCSVVLTRDSIPIDNLLYY